MIERSDERAMPSARSNTYLGLLMATAGLMRLVIAVRARPDILFDDAYITLRYAANLIKGWGFVFNAGERVMGTTSPLFALMLAAGGYVIGASHLEGLAVALGILASLGTIYLCAHILNAAGVPQGVQWTFLALLAFLPSFVSNSVSGMETPVVLFLMSLSLYLYMKNRLMALSLVSVFLVLSRVDTGFWLLALGIAIVSTAYRTKAWGALARPLALFCAGTASWLAFAKIYFGSVVPQSIVGKAVSHGAFELPDWHYVLASLSAFVPAERLGAWGLPVIAAVFLILAPSAVALWRRHPQLRPIVYFFPLYAGVFIAVRAPLFSWYSIPAKWAFYLIAVYALRQILFRAAELSHLSWKPDWALAVAGVCFFGLALQMAVRSRQPSGFEALSDYLERDLTPTSSVFLEHIGLVSYRTGSYIYDSMGLVTPETTRLRRLYGAGWLPKAAREYHADVVVLYDSDLPAVRSQTDEDAIWFQQHYAHVGDYQLPGLVASAYVRNDGAQAGDPASGHGP